MKIIFMLMFLIIPLTVFSQEVVHSTWTETIKITPPTTYQVLLDGIDGVEKKEDKIIEIDKELAKNPDSITGQPLLNYKTTLGVEIKHKNQGRNYIGTVTYPVYVKGK